jgi:hypothetical protein
MNQWVAGERPRVNRTAALDAAGPPAATTTPLTWTALSPENGGVPRIRRES